LVRLAKLHAQEKRTLKKICCIAIIFLPLLALAQGIDSENESELSARYAEVMSQESAEARMEASDRFKAALRESLYKSGALEYPFDSLRMCKMISPDKRFRIFNWNVPLANGAEHYEAILMIPDPKTGMVKLIDLVDDSAEMDKVESRVCKPENWFGALYYDIIPFKKGGGDHYILLGWDGDSRITNKKVIDVISLTGNTVRFGAPIFKTEEGMKKRILFTYAEQISMSIVYQEKEKRIIFDHLAPRNQSLKGQYQFYGPDMSHDALEFKNGKWYWFSNVEFKRKRTGKDKDFNDPRRN
jgi:hypothetical protein